MATTKPFTLAAATVLNGTFHTNNANAAAIRKEIGMALLAGHLSPTRKMATAIIGNKEITAKTPVLTNTPPYSLCCYITKIFCYTTNVIYINYTYLLCNYNNILKIIN